MSENTTALMFGRTVITSSVGSIDSANVVEVLSKAVLTHTINQAEIDYLNNYLKPKFYVVLRKPLKIDIFAEPTKNSSSYSYILTLFTPLPQHI